MRTEDQGKEAAEYRGQCHCGGLTVRVRTAIAPAAWSVRACQCSFCRSHGALTCSDPNGELIFAATDESWLSRYRFARRTADFLICARCGVYVGARFDSDKGRYGIVNLRILPPEPWPAAAPVSYEAESPEARRLRREARWTPVTGKSL